MAIRFFSSPHETLKEAFSSIKQDISLLNNLNPPFFPNLDASISISNLFHAYDAFYKKSKEFAEFVEKSDAKSTYEIINNATEEYAQAFFSYFTEFDKNADKYLKERPLNETLNNALTQFEFGAQKQISNILLLPHRLILNIIQTMKNSSSNEMRLVGNFFLKHWNRALLSFQTASLYSELYLINELSPFQTVLCYSYCQNLSSKASIICFFVLFQDSLVLKIGDNKFELPHGQYGLHEKIDNSFPRCIEIYHAKKGICLQFPFAEAIKTIMNSNSEIISRLTYIQLKTLGPVYINMQFFTTCAICESSFQKKIKKRCPSCGIVVCNEHVKHSSMVEWKGKEVLICTKCFEKK